MRWKWAWLIAVLIGLNASATLHLANMEACAAETVDRIVAVVNEDILTLSDLNQELKPYIDRIRIQGYSLEKENEIIFQLRGRLLEQMINDRLTDQEIKRHKITVSDQELDSAIERIKEARMLTDEQLRAGLKQEGLTYERYRERIKAQIQRNKLVNLQIKSKIVITKDDVRDYYERHPDQYRRANRYHLRHIIMRTSPMDAAAQKQKVLERMQALRARLLAGESFENLAKAFSESSLAAGGGDLGFFNLEDMAPQLREVIQKLEPGQFSEVIDTEQGYQIFLVEEISQTQTKTLEEAAPEIEETLFKEIMDKKFSSWIKDLRKRSHIKVIQ